MYQKRMKQEMTNEEYFEKLEKTLFSQPIRYRSWFDKLLGLPDPSFTEFELIVLRGDRKEIEYALSDNNSTPENSKTKEED